MRAIIKNNHNYKHQSKQPENNFIFWTPSEHYQVNMVYQLFTDETEHNQNQ